MFGKEGFYIYKGLQRYFSLFFGDLSIGRRLKFFYLKKIFKKTIKKRDNIYDAGCGNGFYGFYLIRKFKKVSIFGIDIDKNSIRRCNQITKNIKSKNIHFKEGNLVEYKKSNYFDKILAISATHYEGEKDILIFKNLFDSLKDSGLLITIIPNKVVRSKIYGLNAEKYTKKEILKKLKMIGFKIKLISKISNGYSNKLKISANNFKKKNTIFSKICYLITFTFSLIIVKFDRYFNKEQNASWLIIASK